MLGSAARTKGTWWATLVALVAGLALLVMLTSPGSHPQPAQAQVINAPKVVLSYQSSTIAEFTKMVAVSSIDVTDRRTQAKIVLERPASAGGLDMYAWHQEAKQDQLIAYKNVQLTFVNRSGQTTERLFIRNAWPSEYRLEQRGSQLFEIVTLSAASFERTQL
jgi:tail tube protein gp19